MNKSQLTIMDLVHILLSHLLIILLVGAATGAATWAYTTYKIPKMYRTTVTFYAVSRAAEVNDDVSSSVLSTNRQLASTYSYVLRSNKVMKLAEKKLKEQGVKMPGGGSYGYATLKGMTSVTTTNTELFTATFVSSDRANLQVVANTIAESGAEMIQEIVGGEAKIIDAAEAPGATYSPDVRSKTITGAFIGLLLAAAVIVIRALADTTIWSEEDLSKQYSIPVLGVVPQLASLEKANLTKE